VAVVVATTGERILALGRARSARLLSALAEGPRLVVWPVLLAGLLVFALAASSGVGPLAGPALALLAAATLAEAFPVPIERVAAGATSFANVFIAAAAVLYGWRAAVLVGAGAMLLVELRLRQPPVRLLYNSALYSLGGATAAGFAALVPAHYQIGVASSFGFYLVNVSLLTAVVARVRGERYVRLAVSFYRSTLVPFVVMTAITAILIQLWMRSPFYALLLVAPLVLMVGHQRSLTEALRRQRELDRLKDEFIAVMSHELRTPLTSVLGYTSLLRKRDFDAGKRAQYLEIIGSEAHRLASLVDDFLDADRAQKRGFGLDERLVDLAAVLREQVQIAAGRSSRHTLSLSLPAEPFTVSGDAARLAQVIANLLGNAIKYSPDGGPVEVVAERRNGVARVSVHDPGIGIPAEHRARIFTKFFRGEARQSGIAGTGLGLYICRELLQAMGGEIWMTDNQPRGSTFVFELPLDERRV